MLIGASVLVARFGDTHGHWPLVLATANRVAMLQSPSCAHNESVPVWQSQCLPSRLLQETLGGTDQRIGQVVSHACLTTGGSG